MDNRLGQLVFAHDNIFYRDSAGRIFSDRGRWPWERYLSFSESVTVAARMQEMPPSLSIDQVALSSHPYVSFVSIPSLSDPISRLSRRREALQKLSEVLEHSDALIARLPSEIGSAAVRAAERLKKPWAAEVVTCPWDSLWNYGTWQGKAYAPFAWFQMRRLLRRAPFALYVTNEFLQRRYPSSGYTLGCSDVELEASRAALEHRIDAIDRMRNPLVIGLIGYLGARFKGIHVALKALSVAQEELPPFRLRVLGAGDAQPWVRMASELGLSEHVDFCGTVPAGEPVLRWLDAVDLYIQPSFQEGLPRSLLEAMSRGCPALGSSAGGTPELLSSRCLHRPGDHERLARQLVNAMSNQAWRREEATRNFEVACGYTSTVLDPIRDGFWKQFASYAGVNR